MSNGGRKCVPIPIKKALGTDRADREKEIPDPSPKKPTPPSHLNKRAKQIFTHLVKNRLSGVGFDSATYTEKVALLAKKMEQLEKIDKVIDDEGFTYETKTKDGSVMVRARPEVAIQKEFARHIQSLLSDFGLDPSSAQKVGPLKKSKKKNAKERFFN